MNFIEAINNVLDQDWSAEQKDWESTTEGKEYPQHEPQEKDDHIFKALVAIDKFQNRKISIYGKKTTLYKLLTNITDDELITILEQAGEDLCQSKGMKL